MPIPVSSFLLPLGDNTYFILEDKYIRGGLQIATDAAARDSIIPMNRKPLMLVITEDDEKIWQLQKDLETWEEFKVGAEGDGTGPRQTVQHTITNIPRLSYADFSLPLGNTIIVQKLAVSAPCILEAHSTPDRIDSNPFRFIAIEGHLEDDGSMELTDGSIVRSRRFHILCNLENEPSGQIFFRILNTDEENELAVTLTMLFKPVEA